MRGQLLRNAVRRLTGRVKPPPEPAKPSDETPQTLTNVAPDLQRREPVEALLKATLLREPRQRAAFLESACAGDETLRTELTCLLTSLQQPRTESPEPNSSATQVGQRAGLEETSRASGNEAPFKRGNSLGRYIVLETLGSGGMGVVYAAYDPELDRKIAVKLLHPEASSSSQGINARARLVREAQAMARLSHTNVITVHDVGTIGNEVFIAMEYVEGCTLKHWLVAEPRKWRDIVAMFVQAGRGLSAAHSAGIVHRDFKPHNVLVGKDGRVRVLDFGLARGTIAADVAETAQIIGAGLSAKDIGPKALASDVTRSGMLIGTPAYMAPEQITGGQLDARSDQFSFCVALYQALYGDLPFAGETLNERLTAIREGRLRNPPAAANVPGSLREIVIQGLRSEPEHRHPSMDVLINKLQYDPAKVRRRAAAVAAVVLLATVTPWVSYRVVAHRQSLLCRGAEDKLAGVWDLAKQEAIQKAFLATAKPYAADAFKGVKRALDLQSNAWAAMHTDSCQATRLRGEQSEALLDLRMGCLRSRLDEMRALTDLFAQADAQAVEKSVEAANALTPLLGCADTAALTAQVKPPEDAATRGQVERQRVALAEIEALKHTGKYPQAIEMARQHLAASRETHYRPIEAEALLMLGDLLMLTKQSKEAAEILYQAKTTADEVSDDHGRARSLSLLAYVVGFRDSRTEEGLRLAREASAVVKRLGNPPDLDSRLQYYLGSILYLQGKYKEAALSLKQALDIRQKTFGPEHSSVVTILSMLGGVLTEAGQYDEAIVYHRRAAEISEKVLGSEHPDVANVLNNLGVQLWKRGKLDAALDAYQRALAIREKVFGPGNLHVAATLMNLGIVLHFQGRYAEALSFHRRSLEIHEKALGVDHAELVNVLTAIGGAYAMMGDLDAALVYDRRALPIAEKAFGPEHPKVANLLNNMGGTLIKQGNFQLGSDYLRRSLAIREKAFGSEHPELVSTLKNLAMAVYYQSKKANLEVPSAYLNRALAIQEKASGSESERVADVLVSLGALESGRNPRMGLAHIQRALNIQEKALPADSPLIGFTLSEMGNAYLNLGQNEDAKRSLKRASKLLESSKKDPVDLAWVRFRLARALWDTHSDRERAVTLAQQARATFVKAGKGESERLREVDAWLRPKLGRQANTSLGSMSKREEY